MPDTPPLILASSSPRRHQLLGEMGLPFRVIPSPAEELHDESWPPEQLVAENARRKAKAISAKHPESLVLGADTLVAYGNRILGKPADHGEARAMLRLLSGNAHQVFTAVSLQWHERERHIDFVEMSTVHFHPLSEQAISAYIARVDVLDKAGAYAAQEHGREIIAEIEGSWSNVVGLPLERLREVLTREQLISVNE